MPSICLVYGLAVASGGLSVQGFRVQGSRFGVRPPSAVMSTLRTSATEDGLRRTGGSRFDVRCSMFSRQHRQSSPRHPHPPCLKIENAGIASLARLPPPLEINIRATLFVARSELPTTRTAPVPTSGWTRFPHLVLGRTGFRPA